MRHAFIDSYADLNTPLHKLSARIKVIFFIIFLLTIIFTPIKQKALFLLYGAIIFVLIYLSKVPLRFICKRIMEILPFIIVISTSVIFRKQGYILFFICTVKAVLTILSALIIASTTRFNQLLEALSGLKVPSLFIHLLSFMYRYSFILEDQLLRTSRAYESRNISNKNNFRKIKILSNILGNLFIRAYERSERVYLAMCARGYENEKSN